MTLHVDTFNRADTAAGSGLGTLPNGPSWQHLRGSWRILSNRAYAGTGADAIAVVDLLGPDAASVKVDIDGSGGDALYFRVVDANNWWRVRYRRYTTTSTTTYPPTYTTEYEWRVDPQEGGGAINQASCDVGLDYHYHSDTMTGWGSYSNSPWGSSYTYYHTHTVWFHGASSFCDPGSLYHSHSGTPQKTGNTREVQTSPGGQTSTTTTHYQVYLERCINGSVATISNTTLSGAPNQLIASAEGTTIKYGYRRSTTTSFPVATYTSAAHQSASKYGIGRGPSEVNGTLLDNFSVDVNNTPPGAPVNLSPNDITVSPSQVLTLAWTPMDADPGDYSTGFDLRYRVRNTQTWSTVSRRGVSDTRYDLPADTLFSGETYDWEIRTYDAVNAPGAWASASFFAAEDDSLNTVTPTLSEAVVSASSTLIPASAFVFMQSNVFGEVTPSPDAVVTMYSNVAFPADPSPDAMVFMYEEVTNDFPTPHIWYILADRSAGTMTIVGRGFRANQSGGRVWWGRGTDAEQMLEVISWSRTAPELTDPVIDASSLAGTTVGHEEIVVRLPSSDPGTYDVMVETDSGVVVEATLKYSSYAEGYEV